MTRKTGVFAGGRGMKHLKQLKHWKHLKHKGIQVYVLDLDMHKPEFIFMVNSIILTLSTPT